MDQPPTVQRDIIPIGNRFQLFKEAFINLTNYPAEKAQSIKLLERLSTLP